jgi:hypothetical protein
VLGGTIRARLFELAPAAGLHPEERSMRADELASADAVFATNSLRLMLPIAAIDGRALATETSLWRLCGTGRGAPRRSAVSSKMAVAASQADASLTGKIDMAFTRQGCLGKIRRDEE